MPGNAQRRASGWRPDGSADNHDGGDAVSIHVPIDYRTPPEYLEDDQILVELEWIGDAVTRPGEIGDYARARTAALCTEWMRRASCDD